MEPTETWQHLTRDECMKIEDCAEAWSHHLHWPHEYPQVILATGSEKPLATASISGVDLFSLDWGSIIQDSIAPVVGFTILALILWGVIALIRRRNRMEQNWQEQQDVLHGSARESMISDYEQAGMLGDKTSGLIVGAIGNGPDKPLLRYPGTAHVLTFAPTGSGKGVSAVIPNLLDYEGSVLCIDPKGENAAITARRRREMGQDVHVLDPWGLVKEQQATSSFNPIQWLDPKSPDFAEDCMMIADTLVVEGANPNNHWDNEAKALISGMLMFITCHEPKERQHLVRLYELLSKSGEEFAKLVAAMMNSPHQGVKMAGDRLNNKEEREASNVISSALGNLHFLGSERIAHVLGAPVTRMDGSVLEPPAPLDLVKLKQKRMSVFLILPADRLASQARWLRLLISLSLSAMARDRTNPDKPVLFLLDEFAALGKLQMVQTAMGLMRGYGVKLWPILQDLSQLQALYPKAWQSYIANSGVVQVFGTSDQGTARYFSDLAGQSTHGSESSTDDGRSTFGKTARPLFFPDEIMQIDNLNQLIFVQGLYPGITAKSIYYMLDAFKGQHDPNPYLND